MKASISFAVFFLASAIVYSQTAGPNAPGNVIDGGGGPLATPWSNPNNARMQNDIYASVTTNNSFWDSNYLEAQNFGFNIPAGSSILGIVVEVDRYATITTTIFPADVKDSQVRIIDAAGEIRNSDDESTGAPWPSVDTDTYQSYGGSTNTWGITDWTPAKINSPNFGVAIKARTSFNPLATFNLFVDEIRITVYYVTGGAERYAVNSGNWSDPNSWSFTPGGAPGAPAPVAANDVFIGGGHTITNDIGGVEINSLTIGTTEATPTGKLTFDSNLRDMVIHGGGMRITSDGDILSAFSPQLTVKGDLTLNTALTNRNFLMIMDGGGASIIDGTGTLGRLYANAFTTHVGSITVTNSLAGITLGLINSHTGHLTYSGTDGNMDTNVLDLAPIDNTMEFSQTTLEAPDFNIQKPSVLFYNLIISGNAPKYYLLNITVLGSLTITPTGILSNSGQRGISLHGNWINNNGSAGFDPNACLACTVVFQGDNPQTITNAAGEEFYRVEVTSPGGVTALNNIIIDDQLLMTGGDFDIGANSLTGAANTVFNGGELLIGTLGTTVPELTGTYTITNGVFTFNGAGDQTIRSSASTPAIIPYHTIRLMGSGTKSLSGPIDVVTDIVITGSTILDVTSSNFGINDGGDWTNTGSFNPRNGTVTFNGAASSFITNPAGAIYYNLTINKAAVSSAIVLKSPVTVNGVLTLTDGHIISTSSTLLSLGESATVVSASDASHVKGPVAKEMSTTPVFAFPIGSGLTYMPASVTLTPPGSGNSTIFLAEYFPLEQSVATTQSGVDHVSSQDYWTIQRVTGSTDAAVTLVWKYPSAGESEINNLPDLVVAQWNGTDWISQGNAGTTGDIISGSVTSLPFSSFVQPYFAIGSSSPISNPLSNNRYFVVPTGNWNGTNVWAYQALGPATASEPTSNKHVIILSGNTVTVQDSPASEATKSMASLRVFGTIAFSDVDVQDISLQIGGGGLTLESAANITGSDVGDNIIVGGDITLNNASAISHTVLETNFSTQGNTITGSGGSLPILTINQDNQIFTGSTSYNTLAIANNATNNGTITIAENFSGVGLLTNGATGTIVYEGTSADSQIIDATTPGNTIHLKSNAIVGGLGVEAFVTLDQFGNLILDGSTNYIQKNSMRIQGNLTIQAGAVFDNVTGNHKLDIGGNWINNNGAAGFLSGTANITFNGLVPQSIFTSSGIEVFNNLIINNTSSTGVTLTQGELHIATSLTLTDGIVFTDAANILVLEDNATSSVGSATSFVDGPMKKIGNEAFVFPLGNGVAWARLGLESIAGFDVTTEFTCQYLYTPYSDRTSLDANVEEVSSVEHWLLNRVLDPGNDANCQVRLFWENAASSGIHDLADLRVGNYYNPGTGLKWYNFGGATTNNGNSSGSVVSTIALTSFGPVTFAAEFGFALPIELTSFTAQVDEDRSVLLTWKTASEVNNDYFTVERSANGFDFESIRKVDGGGTTSVPKTYSVTDTTPLDGVSYYRLQQTDYDGKSTYSNVVSVSLPETDWSIYPNPSNGSVIKLQVPKSYTMKPLMITLVDSRGITVSKQEYIAEQSTLELTLDSTLSDGAYLTIITDGYMRVARRLIVVR